MAKAKYAVKERKTIREKHFCIICGREISNEEYESYDGLCQECYEIEIDELDYEEGYD